MKHSLIRQKYILNNRSLKYAKNRLEISKSIFVYFLKKIESSKQRCFFYC